MRIIPFATLFLQFSATFFHIKWQIYFHTNSEGSEGHEVNFSFCRGCLSNCHIRKKSNPSSIFVRPLFLSWQYLPVPLYLFFLNVNVMSILYFLYSYYLAFLDLCISLLPFMYVVHHQGALLVWWYIIFSNLIKCSSFILSNWSGSKLTISFHSRNQELLLTFWYTALW